MYSIRDNGRNFNPSASVQVRSFRAKQTAGKQTFRKLGSGREPTFEAASHQSLQPAGDPVSAGFDRTEDICSGM